MLTRSNRLALLLIGLTACASNPPSSTMPSTPPIVRCGEHVDLEPIEHYPALPVELGRTEDPTDLSSALVQLHAARRYIAHQHLWAIGTAGVVQRNAIKHHGITSCLDDLRRRGVIL